MTETILLVDDDRDVARALAEGLAHHGRTIVVCHDGESAEMVVEAMPVSSIICDIRLSGPFRFEGLDLITALSGNDQRKVILITGRATPEIVEEAKRRGAVAVLQKPFDLQAIEALLPAAATTSASASASSEANIVFVPTLAELIDGDSIGTRFQPIVRVSDGGIFGFEALALAVTESIFRQPDLLFAYASKKKEVLALELACIRQALSAGASLSRDGSLFLNLHPSVLAADELQSTIERESAHFSVPTDRIVLELTEQGAIPVSDRARQHVDSLRHIGIRFAFDDVGMAYSHFSHFDLVKPSFLKVSQHFGTGFETDATRGKLVRRLLSLARDFDAQLILEGIESKETAAAAKESGIPLAQGYYFARPAPAATWIASGASGKLPVVPADAGVTP